MLRARWLAESLGAIDAETGDTRSDDRARFRCAVAWLFAALVLTALYYYAEPSTFRRLCAQVPALRALPQSRFWPLYGLAYWCGLYLLGYLALPLGLLRGAFGMPLSAQGLSLGDTWQKRGVYLGLLAVALPVVIAASFASDFATYYPFYLHAERSGFDLLAWEAMYVLQFVAVEYFFRGYLLAVSRPVMGSTAVFVAAVPYCMVHFGKPVGEALGAIVAGVVLGLLALRTRSIWGGVMVHAGVAVSMDLAALLQGPGLPTRWWP